MIVMLEASRCKAKQKRPDAANFLHKDQKVSTVHIKRTIIS